jgi:DedD protein
MTVDDGLKKRLLGATVLVSLAVIFVPMLLEREPVVETGIYKSNIPPAPERDFSSSVLPLQEEDLSEPPTDLGQVERASPQSADRVEAASKPAPKPQAKPSATPAPKERVGLSAWVIQVGSFSNKDNADRLVEELRKKKYEAFSEQVEVGGKSLTRVRVGPEIDHAKAEQMLIRLNRELAPKKLKAKLKSYP